MDYNLRHARVKALLRDCGVYHINKELIGHGLIKEHKQNVNYLGKRTISIKHLEAMETLLDIILNE